MNCFTRAGMMLRVYWFACSADIRGIMYPIALRKAPNDLSLCSLIPCHKGIRTISNV